MEIAAVLFVVGLSLVWGLCVAAAGTRQWVALTLVVVGSAVIATAAVLLF